MISWQRCGIFALFLLIFAQAAVAEEKPLVGLISKAQHAITIDGKLEEWEGAFVTPLNSTHPDMVNRATHIYYLWDKDALYIGVRALDTNPTHISDENALYDGDAIEFYLDARQGADLGKPDWAVGTLHAFFTAITGHEIKPRFHVRDLPIFKGLVLQGVQLAAVRTSDGYTMEFKLPWANFPTIQPKAGITLGIDIEMGSADGGHRIHRTFAYSSPTSVGTPATHGRVLLVDKVDMSGVKPYSRALCAFDAAIPGNYGRINGIACLSPTISGVVKKIEARLLNAGGDVVKNGENSHIVTRADHWTMWYGEWETYDLPAGTYTLILTARDANNNILVERTRRVLLEP